MKLSRGPLIWGSLLILGGLLLLAQNFGLFGNLQAPIWGIVFGVAAVAFFAAFFTQRGAWWFLIPGFVLTGLGATVLVNEISGQSDLAGSVFLWSIAVAFWCVFLVERSNWWAIIPAGVMTTIGTMPLVAARLPGTATGAVFFLGLGLTFGILYLTRGRYGSATAWAIFPAVACLGMALILGVLGPMERFWPVVFLIVPGLYLLYNALRPRGVSRDSGGSSGAAPN